MKKILIIKNKVTDDDDYLVNKLVRFSRTESIILVKNTDSIKVLLPNSGKKNVKVFIDNIDIETFDLVYFRNWRKFQPLATAIAIFLKEKGKKFIDSEIALPRSGNKLTQMMVLQLNKLPTPKTVFLTNKLIKSNVEFLKEYLGLPLIMKSTKGNKGRDNYKIDNIDEILSYLKGHKNKREFIFQEFIPNKFDYRILVLGNKVGSAERRTRQNKETHLNNASQGGLEEFFPVKSISKDIRTLSIKAAQLFFREVAGVDIVTSDIDNKNYVFEINPSPGFTEDENETTEIKALSDYLNEA